MTSKKVVLAYSGGLDTSAIAKWLTLEGYEVVCFLADLGQKVESLDAIREKGLFSGAKKVIIKNIQEEFVRDIVFEGLQWNALYEGEYLLGTSYARPLITKYLVQIAEEEGADFIAHGATGKGNDQVRFELSAYALNPNIQVIVPWRTPEFLAKFPGRQELIEFSALHGIPVKATKSQPWSSDENLMHISFESGMLEDPSVRPLEEMFELTVSPQKAPDTPTEISITFESGIPISVNGKNLPPHELLSLLNDIGGKNGVGRADIVENRFVGMKSRGVYETPGGTILLKAHRAAESLTLEKDTAHLKDRLMPEFAELVYNGFWYSPKMKALRAFVQETQKNVSATVKLEIYKGNVMIIGRTSEKSLYNQDIASMEADSGKYQPADAGGFIKLLSLPLKAVKRQ